LKRAEPPLIEKARDLNRRIVGHRFLLK